MLSALARARACLKKQHVGESVLYRFLHLSTNTETPGEEKELKSGQSTRRQLFNQSHPQTLRVLTGFLQDPEVYREREKGGGGG